ncbi:MAG: GNAT family N-acetyltransferase [Pseudomonadota bacterium]
MNPITRGTPGTLGTPPTLTTDRLTLRAHRIEDFDAYADLWASDEARFMGGPLDRSAAWGWFCSDVAAWTLQGHGAWAVDRSDDGAHVGQVSVIKLPDYAERELGWLTYAAHRGQGYAPEAARAARDYVFGTLGWDTVVSYIDPDNAASIRVAETLGATPDADADRPDPTDLVYRHRRPQ